MKRDGFTLIELLAVIIILAVVALIATPIVLNVVDDAKKSAAMSEGNMIVSGIQTNCATKEMQAQLKNDGSVTPCQPTMDQAAIAGLVNLGNAKVTGDVTFAGGKVTAITIESNGHTLTMSGTALTINE